MEKFLHLQQEDILFQLTDLVEKKFGDLENLKMMSQEEESYIGQEINFMNQEFIFLIIII